MTRRGFANTLLGHAIALYPLIGLAQQPIAASIGILMPTNSDLQLFLQALREGLREAGYLEGQSIRFKLASAEGKLERLPELARELIDAGADILVTCGTPATLGAASATFTIPIVMVGVGDPVAIGVVENLQRPGRSATGLSLGSSAVIARRLQLLQELVPGLRRVAVILRNEPGLEQTLADIRSNAHRLGSELIEFEITTGRSLELAFMYLRWERCDAVYMASGPLGPAKRAEMIALAAQARLPAIYSFRVFALEGGLMSYAPDTADLFRRAGGFVGRILNGANPAEIPIEPPTKFELIINLKTSRNLGLSVAPSILSHANEVIE